MDKIKRKFKTKEIIDAYKNMINLDVSRYYKDVKEIVLYEDKDSHLEYFKPNLGGGSNAFYSELAMQKWYYSEERWEHKTTLSYLKNYNSVIDIGCGYGAFLDLVKNNNKNIEIYGSEFNENAYSYLTNNKKYHIYNLANYNELNNKKFDIVTSFQVLEHIENPFELIENMIKILNNNGLLIIGVPNNEGIIGHLESVEKSFLNLPPHHLCRWNKFTFSYIKSKYNLDLIDLIEEPIKSSDVTNYVIDRFYVHIRSKFLLKFFLKIKFYKIIQLILKKRIKNKYKGHSILAIFKKNN